MWVQPVFGGFRWRMCTINVLQWAQWVSKSLARCLAHLTTQAGGLNRFFGNLSERPFVRYASWISHFDRTVLDHLFSEELARVFNATNPLHYLQQYFEGSDTSNCIEAMMDVDVNAYLPDDLLVKVEHCHDGLWSRRSISPIGS